MGRIYGLEGENQCVDASLNSQPTSSQTSRRGFLTTIDSVERVEEGTEAGADMLSAVADCGSMTLKGVVESESALGHD